MHYVDDIDDSLDYKVELPATGISKVLKTIPCIFFVNLGNKTANLIALNIYRIEEKDSHLQIYYQLLMKRMPEEEMEHG